MQLGCIGKRMEALGIDACNKWRSKICFFSISIDLCFSYKRCFKYFMTPIEHIEKNLLIK